MGGINRTLYTDSLESYTVRSMYILEGTSRVVSTYFPNSARLPAGHMCSLTVLDLGNLKY